jgi:radical SAM protein (TIGR04043 family)
MCNYVSTHVKVREVVNEIQCLGVRMSQSSKGRNGGAGPAEGQVVVFKGIPINCPTQSSFVKASPFSMGKRGNGFILKKRKEEIGEVTFPPLPNFYQKVTREGIPGSQIALLHGVDCLASTVFQRCFNWQNSRCGFCGIELSLSSGNTIPLKSPHQLSEVAETAMKEDGVTHITLTTGTQNDEPFAFKHLASCAQAIKEKTCLPVHLQFMPPQDFNVLEDLKKAGVDTIGIHIESFDTKVLSEVCPAKARIGLKRYQECWKTAVDLFGRNQVSSFVILGLGEDRSSITEGSAMLCEMGVYPYLLPLRPIPDTIFSSAKPPDPEYASSLYQEVAQLLSRHHLSWKTVKAGCVRCGSCSAITRFEEN